MTTVRNHRKEFMRLLAGLAEYFNFELSEHVAELYFRHLADEPWPALKRVLEDAPRGANRFPTVKEIVDLLRHPSGPLEQEAEIVWGELVRCLERHGHYDSVEFPVEIAEIIETLFGGWIRLSQMTWEELKWARRDFVSAYRAKLKKGFSGRTKVLPGHLEIDNSSKGLGEHIPEPIPFAGRLRKILEGSDGDTERTRRIQAAAQMQHLRLHGRNIDGREGAGEGVRKKVPQRARQVQQEEGRWK